MGRNIKKLVLASMLSALVCIATVVIRIPNPLSGYMNLGDCIVLVCGWLLPPVYSFLSAGLGSGLADIFGGYAVYAPATVVIKGIMAVVAGGLFNLISRKLKCYLSRFISGITSVVFMVTGYYIFEGFIYGFVPSLVNIPANLIQGVAGLLLGLLVAKVFDTEKIKNNINK